MGRDRSRPYGVKGWVKVAPFTAAPDALTRFDRWWIGGPDRWARSESCGERVRHGANVVARLEGCGERDQAAKLNGREVALPRESLPEAQKNEYYWADLVGLEVVNAESDVARQGDEALLERRARRDAHRRGEGRAAAAVRAGGGAQGRSRRRAASRWTGERTGDPLRLRDAVPADVRGGHGIGHHAARAGRRRGGAWRRGIRAISRPTTTARSTIGRTAAGRAW